MKIKNIFKIFVMSAVGIVVCMLCIVAYNFFVLRIGLLIATVIIGLLMVRKTLEIRKTANQ